MVCAAGCAVVCAAGVGTRYCVSHFFAIHDPTQKNENTLPTMIPMTCIMCIVLKIEMGFQIISNSIVKLYNISREQNV